MNTEILLPDESAHLNHARLSEFYARLGVLKADAVLGQTIADLAARLSRVERCFAQGHFDELARLAATIPPRADPVGMGLFARVARDVADLAGRGDDTALAACVRRLGRIGESSLVAVWELQDLSG